MTGAIPSARAAGPSDHSPSGSSQSSITIAAQLSDSHRYHVFRRCVFDGLMRCDPQIDYLRDLGVADVIDLPSGKFMSRLTLLGEDVRAHLLSACKWCTRNGWYESFSGGFAREVPCEHCNPTGAKARGDA
jgi:hypothetical protein